MNAQKPTNWPQSKVVVFAKDQPEYFPLPAARLDDANGIVVTEWRFSWKERLRVLFGTPVKISVMTFGHSLQPMRVYLLGDEDEYERQHRNGWAQVEEMLT